jgi:hypothetical protein
MLKGLASKWKQPLAYFFTQNGMSNPEIAKHVKVMIHSLTEIGLEVDATVCDQYNKAAINALVQETKQEAARIGERHETYTFKVDKREIFPLFDFPHLLKGIRNNMLNYDVKFSWKNGEEIASWVHIEQLYDLDNDDDDCRMLHRLTEEHVRKDKIKKMKVKNAAQVFSHRVQSTMRGLLKHGNTVLPQEAIGTANFLLFVDKLFDSVNGSALNPFDGNLLRRAVTSRTEHVNFWNEALRVLESIQFFSRNKQFVPPSITNWILSIRNLKMIWTKLQSSGFEFLCTRNLNQDPLENFFCCVRSHGVRNINPTCNSFRATFKSLLLNNFLTSHSPSANCEKDETEGVLSGLKSFLNTGDEMYGEPVGLVPLDYADDKLITFKPVKGDIILQVHGYVTGAMAKTLLKSIGFCKLCRADLKTEVSSEEHKLIEAREYKPNILLRPRSKFVVLFGLCSQVTSHYLPILCAENNFHTKLVLIINANIKSDIFTSCMEHNLFQMFVTNFVHFYCFTWVGNVNRILRGSLLCSTTHDVIKQQAFKLYSKYRSRQLALRKTKQLQ